MLKKIKAIFSRNEKTEYPKLSFDAYSKHYVNPNCIYYYAINYEYDYSMCIIYKKGNSESVIRSNRNPIVWTISENCINNAMGKSHEVICTSEFKNAYNKAIKYLSNISSQL